MLGFRGKNDVEKPAGEWNRMEVICDGDTITNIVNGYVVNVGHQVEPDQGEDPVPVRRGRDLLPQDRGPPAREVNDEPPPDLPRRRPSAYNGAYWRLFPVVEEANAIRDP